MMRSLRGYLRIFQAKQDTLKQRLHVNYSTSSLSFQSNPDIVTLFINVICLIALLLDVFIIIVKGKHFIYFYSRKQRRHKKAPLFTVFIFESALSRCLSDGFRGSRCRDIQAKYQIRRMPKSGSCRRFARPVCRARRNLPLLPKRGCGCYLFALP